MFVAGAVRWRQAVFCSLVLAVFDGALRKWIFPESGHLIYFAKDIVLLGAYVGFWGPRVVGRRRLIARHPATVPLVAFGLVAGLQLLNPELPSIWLGLFGIKAYLIYVPLMYMVPALFSDMKALEEFWSRYLLLSIIPLALGPVQFFAPADNILNRYAWEDELGPSIATFGFLNYVRITATFSYLSGYTAYLLVVVLVTLALLAHQKRKRLRRRTLQVVLALAVVNLLMTGSRGPFLVLGVALLLEVILSAVARRPGIVQRALVVTPAVPVLVCFMIGLFPEAWAAFVERVEGNEDVAGRIAGLVTEPWWALGEAGLSGFGIGATHQATYFLIPEASMDTLPPPAEGEWERIILEVGPVGFLLVIAARLFVISHMLRAWRSASKVQPIVAAALMFVVVSLPGSLVFNHTASLFYWVMAGVALVYSGQRSTAYHVALGSTHERVSGRFRTAKPS